MNKILIYDDNPDFGGHQVMAAYAVEAFAGSPLFQPLFFHHPANPRLIERLCGIAAQTGNLELRSSPFQTRRFQGLRNYFSTRSIRRLADRFRTEAPALILCIQGDIEDSSLAVLAARRAGIRCISYIPVPHSLHCMGARLGTLRDLINRPLFNRPDGYITISESMRDLLRERGCTRPVEVVWNGIETQRFSRQSDPTEARRALGLPETGRLVGLIGRIEFNQKQQDFAVRAWQGYPEAFGEARLVIVGDGPDREKLEQQIAELHMTNRILLLPWQNDPTRLYNALDLLVIPSRFEGVPLVMLEALCNGVPIAASARDGMKDLLPPAWTFTPEDPAAFAKTFAHVAVNGKNEIEPLTCQVREKMNILAFKNNFLAKIQAWTKTRGD